MGDFSIQISADLVNRLANGGEKSKRKLRKTKPKLPREPARKVNEKVIHADSDARKVAPSSGWPVQHPLYLPVAQPPHSENAELEQIKSVIQESEKVLDKLKRQEESMAKEVTERAKDLRDKEFKLPYQKPMPCLSDYEACRSCYKENGNDILKCAPLTKSYYDCVRRVKQQVSLADKRLP